MKQGLVGRVVNYFTVGHERTLKAKKNIVISVLVKGLSLLSSFVMVSLTIHYVNNYNYGIWLLLSGIISWFSTLDIGLANGLKNKVAEAHANQETKSSRIYISTTYALMTIIAGFFLFFFLILNRFIPWSRILNVGNSNHEDFHMIALILVGFFCLQFVLQVINVVLTATHAIGKSALIGLVGQLLSLLVMYVLVQHTEGSLLRLILVYAGIPLLTLALATVWLFRYTYRELSPSFRYIQMKYAKKLLGTGVTFFFVQIGAMILYQTDNIVITQLFGPVDVTTFNLSYKVFSSLGILFILAMNPFWSAFTDAYVKNDFLWIKNVFNKLYISFFCFSLISFIVLAISPIIFKLWVHREIPFSINLVMALYPIVFIWLNIHCFFLNGIGKIKIQLYCYIICSVINIPLAVFFARIIGVSGVMLSNVVVMLGMDIVLYIQCKRITAHRANGVWNA